MADVAFLGGRRIGSLVDLSVVAKSYALFINVFDALVQLLVGDGGLFLRHAKLIGELSVLNLRLKLGEVLVAVFVVEEDLVGAGVQPGSEDCDDNEDRCGDFRDGEQLAFGALGLVFPKEGISGSADGAESLLIAFLHQNRDNQHKGNENQDNTDDDRH